MRSHLSLLFSRLNKPSSPSHSSKDVYSSKGYLWISLWLSLWFPKYSRVSLPASLRLVSIMVSLHLGSSYQLLLPCLPCRNSCSAVFCNSGPLKSESSLFTDNPAAFSASFLLVLPVMKSLQSLKRLQFTTYLSPHFLKTHLQLPFLLYIYYACSVQKMIEQWQPLSSVFAWRFLLKVSLFSLIYNFLHLGRWHFIIGFQR